MFRRTGIKAKFLILTVFCTGVFVSASFAGNKEMIEGEVKDLDALNKQAVQQIPDLPGDGHVSLKADVTYENGEPVFNIYHKEVTAEPVEINETDEPNQQAVQQTPGVSEDNQDSLKTDAAHDKGSPIFDVYNKEVSPEPVKEKVISFDNNYQIKKEEN